MALAENFLRRFISGQLRVRVHGDLARIEVEPQDFQTVISVGKAITEAFKEFGFIHTSLDLAGFHSGSFDA